DVARTQFDDCRPEPAALVCEPSHLPRAAFGEGIEPKHLYVRARRVRHEYESHGRARSRPDVKRIADHEAIHAVPERNRVTWRNPYGYVVVLVFRPQRA